VILWSDSQTTFAGTIFARGGANGGDGGFVEVSGKQQLAFTGKVDTSAPMGKTGDLLLDPYNVIIDSNGSGSISGGSFTPTADDSHIGASVIAAALSTNNVTITTGGAGSPGTQAGNITIDGNTTLSWNSANTLTLSAYNNISFGYNSSVTSTGGGNVVLRADNSGTGSGTVFFGEGSGVVTSGAVSIFYNPRSYTDSYTKSDSSGNPYSSFVTGGGTLIAYMLVNNVENLQTIQSNLSGNYALSKDIDATSTASWNENQGFTPIGSIGNSGGFTGRFDGQNYTITGLAIAPTGGKQHRYRPVWHQPRYDQQSQPGECQRYS